MKRRSEYMLISLCWTAVIIVMAGLSVLILYLLWRGVQTIGPTLFFGDTPWFDALTGRAPVFGGIWPALAGTLALIITAAVIAVPTGVGAGIYLTEYASPRQKKLIGWGVDLLGGVPSIVMGLFGFTLILFLRRTFIPEANTCLLLAGFCLGLLVLPYLIRTTANALESLPEGIRMIGPSLGMSHLQNILHVLLPSAARGILSGIILAIGRAAEDAAVIMLAGAVMSFGLPGGLLKPFEALPFRIYFLSSEYRNTAELNGAFGAALVLLVLTTGLFLFAFYLRKRIAGRWET